jgi:hypothetical protein
MRSTSGSTLKRATDISLAFKKAGALEPWLLGLA